MQLMKALPIMCLALAGAAAQAAVLSTASLPPSELDGNRESACVARNPGEAPLEVTIEGFDTQGRRVAFLTFDLLPGSTRLGRPKAPGRRRALPRASSVFPGARASSRAGSS